MESEVEPFMSEDAHKIEYIPHSQLANNIHKQLSKTSQSQDSISAIKEENSYS